MVVKESKMKLSRLISLLFLGCALAAALVFSFQDTLWSQEMNKKHRIPKAGDIAPNFTLEDFDGGSFTLSKMRNSKVVLLWFTNLCSGCLEKLPKM